MFRERTSEFVVQNLSSCSFKLIIMYSCKGEKERESEKEGEEEEEEKKEEQDEGC